MHIILNHSSMVPIYEQLMEQIKSEIIQSVLKEGEVLPSVRTLAGELRISALTVKKAYDKLEEEGFVTTVHGKGTYVTASDKQLASEARRIAVEEDFDKAIDRAVAIGMKKEEILGLDVEARNEILDLLREYIAQDEKRTILITSHISTDLESLCDDIYLIHDGKIILHEDTDVILEQYGILKVNEEQYRTLDKTAVIKVQKETYGYACFTNDRRFYQENYPQIAVEQGGIDELILMMTGGYR